MKLSTKGRYAITAMLELASRHKDGPVTLADISGEQSISVSYLEQLFAQLRKHDLVTGLRGPGGGYCLRRPANEISIAQILSAVDEAAEHEGKMTENLAEQAQSLVMWDRLSERIYDYLNHISLADAIAPESGPDGEEPEHSLGKDVHRSAA